MSDKALLIDFGATRIKSATVELKTGKLTHNFVSNGSHQQGANIPVDFFCAQLVSHLNNVEQVNQVQAILFCCEMHGFVRYKNQDPSSGIYTSWRHSSDQDYDAINLLDRLFCHQWFAS